MELSEIIPHIEALIFASEKPVTSLEITELINNAFGFMEDKITLDQVEAALEGVIEKYRADFYPFEVRESGGGWQFLTKKEYHKTVAQLNGDKYLKRLSNAALETLSIIAYKQPITKGEIEAIRGVSADYSIQKLLEKELIIITGRNEELPGKPLVYATSKSFMDYFGLNSPDDLPRIKEVLTDQAVMPTVVNDPNSPVDSDQTPVGDTANSEATVSDNEGAEEAGDLNNLVVRENGELEVEIREFSGAAPMENSDSEEDLIEESEVGEGNEAFEEEEGEEEEDANDEEEDEVEVEVEVDEDDKDTDDDNEDEDDVDEEEEDDDEEEKEEDDDDDEEDH